VQRLHYQAIIGVFSNWRNRYGTAPANFQQSASAQNHLGKNGFQ
jgi:hypothetical protein